MEFNHVLTIRIFETDKNTNDDKLLDKTINREALNYDNKINSISTTYSMPKVLDSKLSARIPSWLYVVKDRYPICEVIKSEAEERNTYKMVPIYLSKNMYKKFCESSFRNRKNDDFIDIYYLFHTNESIDKIYDISKSNISYKFVSTYDDINTVDNIVTDMGSDLTIKHVIEVDKNREASKEQDNLSDKELNELMKNTKASVLKAFEKIDDKPVTVSDRGVLNINLNTNYLGSINIGDTVMVDSDDLYIVNAVLEDKKTHEIVFSISPVEGIIKDKDNQRSALANEMERYICSYVKAVSEKSDIDSLETFYQYIVKLLEHFTTALDNKDKNKLSKKERQAAYHYPDTQAFEYIMSYFKKHGVTIKEMAEEAMNDQLKHGVKAPLKAYEKAIIGTLHKRDIDSLILVGLALDSLCTQKLLPEPLQSMMWNDAPAFSPDETICELIGLQYSGIAVTNYGARDVHKQGLAKRIDEDNSSCNVFLDDFVSVLIAVAEAKVAHRYGF